MHLGSWIAAAGVAAMMGAGAAQATPSGAPAATLQTAVDVGPAPAIELVRGGCGFGEHRGFYHCRYNRGVRGFLRYRRNHRFYRHHFYHRYY